MMHSRVLITGCAGMLGHAIYPYFAERYETVLATDRVVNEPWLKELDIRHMEAVRTVFEEFRPQLVLHLAAETDLEFCETHPEIAKATNDVATRHIAELCETFGVTLVYISTAGVFDGKKEGLYIEQDQPNPIMVYGQTKLAGEQHTRQRCSRHYVVRAGWMVGGGQRKDHKFVSLILSQILAGKKVLHVVHDKWGTPTYTHDFANNLFMLLETDKYGTYHMVCEGTGTRYDVARHIVSVLGMDDDVEVLPVGSEFFRERYFVPRPRSEMLLNSNLRQIGLNLMRRWEHALRDYVQGQYSPEVARLSSETQARS